MDRLYEVVETVGGGLRPARTTSIMVLLKQSFVCATLAVASILGQKVSANDQTYSQYGLTWGNGLRMNQIQVIGTHNSYHREVSLDERPYHATLLSDPQNYYYSHAALDIQASYQSVRSFELDIWADPEGGKYATPLVRKLAHLPFPSDPAMNKTGAKVLHVSDADVGTTCSTLIECLTVIKDWSKAHPQHVPIPCMIEFKVAGDDMAYLHGATPLPWNDTDLLASLDAEIRSVFTDDELITPDHIRRPGLTLEQSVLHHGWPDLDSARGRFMFLMDDGPLPLGPVRDAYTASGLNPNLENRILFTQSQPNQPDCAFLKLNNPLTAHHQIHDAVAKNYYVRTRADIPLDTFTSATPNNITAMRDAALASGAQIVSTDWPVEGMSARYGVDYVVRFEGRKPVRCNPVTVPPGGSGKGCVEGEEELEPGEYFRS